MFTKILGAALALGVLLLTWIAFSESKRADYWANFERTRNARAASAARRKNTEPEPENSDTDFKEEENLTISHAESN